MGALGGWLAFPAQNDPNSGLGRSALFLDPPVIYSINTSDSIPHFYHSSPVVRCNPHWGFFGGSRRVRCKQGSCPERLQIPELTTNALVLTGSEKLLLGS